jgi:zeaxanthin epoxidase
VLPPTTPTVHMNHSSDVFDLRTGVVTHKILLSSTSDILKSLPNKSTTCVLSFRRKILVTMRFFVAAALTSSVAAFTVLPSQIAPKRAPTFLRQSSTALVADSITAPPDEITPDSPLRVLIAGAGVGGLALANVLSQHPAKFNVTVLEQTAAFKRFGGPIQLASNAMQILSEMDSSLYAKVCEKFTTTGDKVNGIKDGIRTEWYAKFDLKSPAADRSMPFTGVIDRPDLQEIYLSSLPEGTVKNSAGVESYEQLHSGAVKVYLQNNETIMGDVLIGADGIWSKVRATMRNQPAKGPESGATYSGYTVFAGELAYASPDNGEVGYKVYIGPGQYFVITDIGKGNYQWYAFLARPAGYSDQMEKPNNSTSEYLQKIFAGWSEECHHILRATAEHEIEQRDLYDRPPSVLKPWTNGSVALLGDGIHAMMPNLGQGGCQAIEDAFVLSQELEQITHRSQLESALQKYQSRRLIRSAAVQGLSRFASDIIIRGFDTPAKIVRDEETGAIRFENFNYAGIVTKMLQPILPLFFMVQFNFLYDGYQNKRAVDLPAVVGFTVLGSLLLFILLLDIDLSVLAGGALFTEWELNADKISSAIQGLYQ